PIVRGHAEDRLKSSVESAHPTSLPPRAADGRPQGAYLRRLQWVYGGIGASALLTFASFHPIDLGLLVFVCLVPWLYVAAGETRRVAAIMSYSVTFLYNLVGIAWIAVVTQPGWLVTVFLEGFYGVMLGLTTLSLRKRTGLPLVVVLPPVGVAIEWLRGNIAFISFPWLYWGHALHDQTHLIQFADVASTYGLSFLVLMVNGALVDVLLLYVPVFQAGRDPSPAQRARARAIALAPVAALALVWCYGWLRMRQVEGELDPGPQLMVVQTNIPQDLKDDPPAPGTLAQINFDLTRSGLSQLRADPEAKPLDAILWSETMWPSYYPLPAVKGDPTRTPPPGDMPDPGPKPPGYQGRWPEQPWQGIDPELPPIANWERWASTRLRPDYLTERQSYLRRLFALASQAKVPLLVGSMDSTWADMSGIYTAEHNSYYRIAPEGPEDERVTARYDKIELVPASEYIPGKDGGLLYPLYAAVKSFVPPGFVVFERGRGPVLMQAGDYQLAPNICFEISFAELLRQSVLAGADVHVCPANDGWFVRGSLGEEAVGTAEIPLARAHARFRAIESRRGVVRCVNRGVSLTIDPLGRIHSVLERHQDKEVRQIGIDGVLITNAPTTKLTTLYVWWGNLWVFVCMLAVAGLGACAWRGRRLLAEPPGPEPEPATATESETEAESESEAEAEAETETESESESESETETDPDASKP
ncbi:MAG: hypothetical protein KDD82_30980, partial [Planctomycetes bacterium]|nr:hypothetical protein [Planctomycetota bacterium]